MLFLEEKGYAVDTVNNGLDAVEQAAKQDYDIIFLDENMPGLSGLETLERIKDAHPMVPVVRSLQERGGAHHGGGHQGQDRRLPDQARTRTRSCSP